MNKGDKLKKHGKFSRMFKTAFWLWEIWNKYLGYHLCFLYKKSVSQHSGLRTEVQSWQWFWRIFSSYGTRYVSFREKHGLSSLSLLAIFEGFQKMNSVTAYKLDRDSQFSLSSTSAMDAINRLQSNMRKIANTVDLWSRDTTTWKRNLCLSARKPLDPNLFATSLPFTHNMATATAVHRFKSFEEMFQLSAFGMKDERPFSTRHVTSLKKSAAVKWLPGQSIPWQGSGSEITPVSH